MIFETHFFMVNHLGFFVPLRERNELQITFPRGGSPWVLGLCVNVMNPKSCFLVVNRLGSLAASRERNEPQICFLMVNRLGFLSLLCECIAPQITFPHRESLRVPGHRAQTQ